MTGSFQQKNIGVGTGFLTEFRLQNSGGLADRAPIFRHQHRALGDVADG